jgi:hypothetical protein
MQLIRTTNISAAEETSNDRLWEQILAAVSAAIPRHSFETWFRPIEFISCDQASLCLAVPNDGFKEALLENFPEVLKNATRLTTGASLKIVLFAREASQPPEPGNTPDQILPLTVVRASALQAPSSGQLWLIERLWTAQAVGILGGAPKCLKSWLALEMAVSVASGSPCLGAFPIHQRGPVLLYAAEDSPSIVRLRLQSLASHHQLDLEQLEINLIAADSLYLDRAVDQDRLAATVRLHRPALLILDPLVRLHTADENVAGQMAALLGYLRTLQRATGVAISVVHHARKNPSPSGGAGYSLRGSSDVYAWLDSLLYLQRRRKRLMLSAEHRSAPGLEPLDVDLIESSDGPHLELLASTPDDSSPSADPLHSQILELLSKSMDPVTADRMRATLQVRNQRVVEALRRLAADGQITRLQNGYSLSLKH